MSHFTVYVDQEPRSQVNVSQAAIAPGIRTAPVGKRFVSGVIQEIQSARKALGDVKNQYGGQSALRSQAHKAGSKPSQLSQAEKSLKPTALTASVFQAHSHLDACKGQAAQDVTQQKTETKEPDWGPKEHMIAYNWEEEDNFEDLWPLEDRPTTYLQNILEFRPPIICCEQESELEAERDHSFDFSGYTRPRENTENEEMERLEFDDPSPLSLDITGLTEFIDS